MNRMLLRHTLVHRIVRKHINVIPIHAGSFGNLQLLQVARQGRLSQPEAFLLQLLQQFLLATDFLAGNNNLNGIKSITFSFLFV